MYLSSDLEKHHLSEGLRAIALILIIGLFLTCRLSIPVHASTRQSDSASASKSSTAALSSSRRTASASRWQNNGGTVSYVYSTGRKATGFLKTGGRWYHFDSDGNLSRGWFIVNGSRFYGRTVGSAGQGLGSLMTGFCRIYGVYYYFEPAGRAGTYGKQRTGWVTSNGNTYYYYDTGSMAFGAVTIGTRSYYFAQTGAYRNRGRVITGWKKLNGKKYYFRKNGSAGVFGSAYKSTTVKIGKKYYVFDSDGVMIGKGTTRKKAKAAASGSSDSSAQEPVTTNDKFVEQIGALAHADMQSSGILASVTAAQAILESNYGKSILATRAHNLFGMKASLSGNNWGSSWNGKVYKKKTLEFKGGRYITVTAKFRRYSNWSQSIADHSAYLAGAMNGSSHRYAGIVGEKNYRKAASIIKNGGYATAPNYVSAICAVIQKYDLTRFDS